MTERNNADRTTALRHHALCTIPKCHGGTCATLIEADQREIEARVLATALAWVRASQAHDAAGDAVDLALIQALLDASEDACDAAYAYAETQPPPAPTNAERRPPA